MNAVAWGHSGAGGRRGLDECPAPWVLWAAGTALAGWPRGAGSPRPRWCLVQRLQLGRGRGPSWQLCHAAASGSAPWLRTAGACWGCHRAPVRRRTLAACPWLRLASPWCVPGSPVASASSLSAGEGVGQRRGEGCGAGVWDVPSRPLRVGWGLAVAFGGSGSDACSGAWCSTCGGPWAPGCMERAAAVPCHRPAQHRAAPGQGPAGAPGSPRSPRGCRMRSQARAHACQLSQRRLCPPAPAPRWAPDQRPRLLPSRCRCVLLLPENKTKEPSRVHLK